MQTTNTFTATIYIGSKEGYDGKSHTYQEAKQILQNYCNNVPYGLTLKSIEFIYKDGSESGFEIGLINYPRFPSNPEEITKKAIEIAEIFKKEFNQYRISIVCSDKTYMIE
jgi:hypothetical protein